MQRSFSSTVLSTDFLASMQKSLQHNKFASVLFQADKLDAALDHYTKALKIAEDIGLPFSNLLQNIGNVYAQRKEYALAKDFFLRVLTVSPWSEPSPYSDVPKPVQGEEGTDHQMVLYADHLNSFEAFVDAHTNLSFTLLGMGEPEAAIDYCRKSLQLRPNKEAHINFGNALRQVGQRDEAIKLVIDSVKADMARSGHDDFEIQRIDAKAFPDLGPSPQDETITFVCVKWGTKYDAEYVNKLYRGIKRNSARDFTLVCFTDDSNGLDPAIEARPLIEDWKGWWGKASIFSNNHGFTGLNIFIDLDMIITGSLDKLYEYRGHFCLLRTDELFCETQNKGGYNSSIVLWRSTVFEPIYTTLRACYSEVNQYIYR